MNVEERLLTSLLSLIEEEFLNPERGVTEAFLISAEGTLQAVLALEDLAQGGRKALLQAALTTIESNRYYLSASLPIPRDILYSLRGTIKGVLNFNLTAETLWGHMMDNKTLRATAVLNKPITMRHWQGHGREDEVVDLPKGTKVKVVMASRFGDVGLTDDLKAEDGYSYRCQCIPMTFEDGTELTVENLLTDIQLV